MPTLLELTQETADLIDKARAVQMKAQTEGRTGPESWTDAESEEIDSLTKAAMAKKDEHAKLQKRMTNSQNLLMLQGNLEGQNLRGRSGSGSGSELEYEKTMAKMAWRTMNGQGRSREFMLGRGYGTAEYPSNGYNYGSVVYNAGFEAYLRGGAAAHAQYMASTGMTSGVEERGGYFITSEAFTSEIIKQMDDQVFMQGLSGVMMLPPNTRSIGVRVRKSRASTFAWEGENTDSTPTLDTSLKYGKRVMTPHYIRGSIDMSRDLLRLAPNIQSEVINELMIDFSYKLEPALLYGDGNHKPLGVMTPSTDGIYTDRDVTCGSATTLSFNDFVNAKYSLKGKYRAKATWMLHRLVLNRVALLTDGAGQYLWQPSRQVSEPDRILGLPLVETEWMPSTFTTGLYIGLLGDFSYYRICYDMQMEMQRLIEKIAEFNADRFLFQAKLDGMPILSEAFSRMILA